ncbi:MAG: selenide, water dikinase SelD [Flavobacteriales bacterium]
MEPIKLTSFSHGAGCGCKLSPAVLDSILAKVGKQAPDAKLLVGNSTNDDAAVYDLGDGTAIVSTTDFFMPIVDDPIDFGRIAATNAISDVYAMGGTPLLAIAILGWPIDKLDPAVAGDVVEGGRRACAEAGIALAGGHSIDSPEPIFGLAVTGRVAIAHLKHNSTAREGDLLFLTKGLGVGIVSTAQKKGTASPDDLRVAVTSMQTLNRIGEDFGRMEGVHAMTDVTGFGLLGHLVELCQGSQLGAEVDAAAVPMLLPHLADYHRMGAVPGGTRRNYASYGRHVDVAEGFIRDLLCDPQTSGGLLVAVAPDAVDAVTATGRRHGLELHPIGRMTAHTAPLVRVR